MGRVLVTGAAGFIGSHVVERLLAEGYEVVGVDSFTDYYNRHLKRANLVAGVGGGGRFWLVEADLLEPGLDALLEGVEGVIHLAAEPGVRPSFGERFSLYVERNVNATRALLEAVRRRGVRRFVHASSSSVYGPAPGRPVREEDGLHPASPYALSKLAGEQVVGSYAREGLETVVLRYFTVYGPRQRPDMAISRFISLAGEGYELEIFGDGSQVREFTYVVDAAEATIRALQASPGAYNIGGGGRASVAELVEMVGETLGKRVRVRHLPSARGDVASTWADCEKAARELGYSPSTDLEHGIREQVECVMEREALGA